MLNLLRANSVLNFKKSQIKHKKRILYKGKKVLMEEKNKTK